MNLPNIFGKKLAPSVDTSNKLATAIVAFGNPDIKEAMQGEVQLKPAEQFFTELGEEHPFDFSITEGLYRKFGFCTGVIDKYVDFIIGPGYEINIVDETDSPAKEAAEEVIRMFRKDYDLDIYLRRWIKEGLKTGNGFMELGLDNKSGVGGLNILNAQYMYVQRDKKGSILGYNQYVGGFDKLEINKIINFKPDQIAHLIINQSADSAYGIGKIYPAMSNINNVICHEKSLNMLMERKANTPYNVTIGNLEAKRFPTDGDITAFGQKLEWLHNKHEWVHGPDVTIEALNFGDIGGKFEFVLKHNLDMLFFTFQVPEVLMGRGSIPEGLATVQMEAFKMTCKAIQDEIEKVVEKQIIKRVLNTNGFDFEVELKWLPPSDADRIARITLLNLMAGKYGTAMDTLIEYELIELLNFDEEEYEELKKEEKANADLQRQDQFGMKGPPAPGEPPKPPPQPNPGDKKPVVAPTKKKEMLLKGVYAKTCSCSKCLQEDFVIEDKDYELAEFIGYNYQNMKKIILQMIALDKFEDLRAFNPAELLAGYLTKAQVSGMRNVFLQAFSEGKSVNWIKKELVDNAIIPPLMKEDQDGNWEEYLSADKRAYLVSRTESVRLASQGNLKYFEQSGIEQVSWICGNDERTCEDCMALNGQIFDIDACPQQPLHVNCRCNYNSVVK